MSNKHLKSDISKIELRIFSKKIAPLAAFTVSIDDNFFILVQHTHTHTIGLIFDSSISHLTYIFSENPVVSKGIPVLPTSHHFRCYCWSGALPHHLSLGYLLISLTSLPALSLSSPLLSNHPTPAHSILLKAE